MAPQPPPGIPSNLVTPARTVIESAMAAFDDAKQLRIVIATLEAYERHKSDIAKKVENDHTMFIGDCVWRSLWWHLFTLVARAYADPQEKKGDLHANVAFERLKDSATRHAAVAWPPKGNDRILDEATKLWAQCVADPKVKSVIMVRHKQIAHWAVFGFANWPTPNDAVVAARMTAEVLEKLAHGIGVATLPFYSVDYGDQAERFWSRFVS
jgi:hypothetical protein